MHPVHVGIALASSLAAATLTAQPGDVRARVRAWIAMHQLTVVHGSAERPASAGIAADRMNSRRNGEQLCDLRARPGFAAGLLETAGSPLVYRDHRAPSDNNQHEENENARVGHSPGAIEIVAALVVA
jgi:hypothetical protein